MKRIFCYLMAICLLAACIPEIGETPQAGHLEEALEGEPVTVNFSVPGIPVLTPTKAQGDIGGSVYLDPEKFFLVVCGHSQSIKYIRKVKYEGAESVYVADIPNYPLDSEAGETTTLYNFSVQLELSDSDRTIHFLGNVDEGQLITGSYAYQILPKLLSEEGKQAYWQSVHLSKILPKRITKPDGTTEAVMEGGFYVLDETIADSLRFVPLVRNFSKVRISNHAENFEIYSYAVVHQPKRGSVVPYRENATRDEKFVFFHDTEKSYQFSGYERCGFADLDALGYTGSLPAAENLLADDVPSADWFEDPSQSGGRVIRYVEGNEDQGVFVYERGAPSASVGPTYIILRGRFTNSEMDPDHSDGKGYYYYRLDLMETRSVEGQTMSKYYPLYRNFRYDIAIHRVSSIGVSTPEAAVTSSGMEDISADWSMRHLSDISNGATRLVVEPYMAQTFTGPLPPGNYRELYVRFFDDITSATPNKTLANVFVELEPLVDANNNVLDDIVILYDDAGNPLSGDAKYFPAVRQSDGVRTIRFNTTNPGAESRTQKIKITGQISGQEGSLPLYREVEISLQKLQTMTLSCDPARVGWSKGSEVTLNITIPAGLPESMFPLEFVIEPVNMTLTPDNKRDDNNLPVHSGPSLANSSKTAFQFTRTLTLSEYNQRTSGGSCTFPSYFKTNRKDGGTDIYVENKFFEPASVTLEDALKPTNQFYVIAEGDCFVQINSSSLNYKVNDGAWASYAANSSVRLSEGDKVSFTANPSVTAVTNWRAKFYCTAVGSSTQKDGKFRVGGNIASLIVGDDYEKDGAGITNYSFQEFFKGHTGLSDASALELPMKKCAVNCYYQMFNGCTSLTKGPVSLPATTMAASCYQSMFYGCASLTVAPASLPATTLANNCYKEMFRGCTLLTSVPTSLPATTLANGCYEGMFYACTNLATVPATLPATTLANNCYKQMFRECKALVTSPSLPAQTLAEACYDGMFYACTILATVPATLPATTLTPYCYRNMFRECKALVTSPSLPAQTLAEACYDGMFYACTNLATVPATLPAETLTPFCYRNMFRGCTPLTTAPVLPATTAARSCYEGMFYDCTGLTAAPALPATTLAECCYKEMFRTCTSLQSVPALPATAVADSCYFLMFRSCTGLTTVNIELPAMTLCADCYREMFRGCSNLTSVPVFRAPTLAVRCYQQMLSGCKKLKTVKCLATDISATDCTKEWLSDGVPNTTDCTFYRASSMTVGQEGGWQRSTSGIPTNWSVVEYTEP